MKAQFKSGKIISGRLAEIFTAKGITKEIPEDVEVNAEPAKKTASKKGRPAKKKE